MSKTKAIPDIKYKHLLFSVSPIGITHHHDHVLDQRPLFSISADQAAKEVATQGLASKLWKMKLEKPYGRPVSSEIPMENFYTTFHQLLNILDVLDVWNSMTMNDRTLIYSELNVNRSIRLAIREKSGNYLIMDFFSEPKRLLQSNLTLPRYLGIVKDTPNPIAEFQYESLTETQVERIASHLFLTRAGTVSTYWDEEEFRCIEITLSTYYELDRRDPNTIFIDAARYLQESGLIDQSQFGKDGIEIEKLKALADGDIIDYIQLSPAFADGSLDCYLDIDVDDNDFIKSGVYTIHITPTIRKQVQ